MRRREVVALLAAGAGWRLAAHAQSVSWPVIGFLSGSSADQDARRLPGFRQGLSEMGYIESRNVAIEYRWAEERMDRLPAFAADLVSRKVAVIVSAGHVLGAVAAKNRADEVIE